MKNVSVSILRKRGRGRQEKREILICNLPTNLPTKRKGKRKEQLFHRLYLELLEPLLGTRGRGDLEYVVTNCLGKRSALAHCYDVTWPYVPTRIHGIINSTALQVSSTEAHSYLQLQLISVATDIKAQPIMWETGSKLTICLPGLYTAMPMETQQEKCQGATSKPTKFLPEAGRDVDRHVLMPLLKSETITKKSEIYTCIWGNLPLKIHLTFLGF